MSTFNGRIKELENVLVDNFLSYEHFTCFFLSHCHSDHMHGLNQLFSAVHKKSNHFLYCSPISRLILLNKYNILNPDEIKELTTTTTIIVPESNVSPSYEMIVTPLPAGHCPGSIMFLFETVNTTVLYTGDFRIMEGDLMKFKPLHFSSQVKQLDKLYFDSTFLNEKYWNFPSRSDVVFELINIINNWLNKDADHHVLLKTSALFGYEFVFTEIAKKLKCKVHVEDSVFKVFWNVPEVGFALTNNFNESKIHVFSIKNKSLPFRNSEDVLKIKLSAQWYKSTKTDIKQPIWKEISKQNIVMCYSNHCSCSELMYVLNYLHPKEIEACTSTVSSSERKKKRFIQQIISTWPIQKKRKKSPDAGKGQSPLEKNFKFSLKFPVYEKKKCADLLEIPFVWDINDINISKNDKSDS